MLPTPSPVEKQIDWMHTVNERELGELGVGDGLLGVGGGPPAHPARRRQRLTDAKEVEPSMDMLCWWRGRGGG